MCVIPHKIISKSYHIETQEWGPLFKSPVIHVYMYTSVYTGENIDVPGNLGKKP